MNIIGIHDGHNASVALLRNGRLIYALSEERLVRRKNEGGVPVHALERLLLDNKLSPSMVDYVAVGGTVPPRPEWIERDKIMHRYKMQCERHIDVSLRATIGRITRALKTKIIGNTNRSGNDQLSSERMHKLLSAGFQQDQIHFIDHHLCHAASAYFAGGSSNEKSLVLTNDGGGDGLCATVSVAKNGQITRLAEIVQADSFATLYGRTTFLMGMVPLEHEYKIMGMAPYGDAARARVIADQILDHFEWPKQQRLLWKRKSGLPPTYQWGTLLEKIFRFKRFDDISAALQMVAEEMALKWVQGCLQETGAKRLVLGGGLFMNVKLNKLILELPEVDDLYIMPSCSDESNSIGAAYMGAIENGVSAKEIAPLKDLYLGAIYSDEDIRSAVADYPFICEVEIEEPDQLEDRVATLLAEGMIVARYSGREEFGARALGNRSILSDPSCLENIVRINKMIKQRDFWMPFAGSMIESQADINLKNPKKHPSNYMIITFDSIEDRSAFRAATHPYDGTIRPQVVKKEWNPGYHEIIRLFEQKCGHSGGILNTSFNLHGFPIVSNPHDAIDVFHKSGLNCLALGPLILLKK